MYPSIRQQYRCVRANAPRQSGRQRHRESVSAAHRQHTSTTLDAIRKRPLHYRPRTSHYEYVSSAEHPRQVTRAMESVPFQMSLPHQPSRVDRTHYAANCLLMQANFPYDTVSADQTTGAGSHVLLLHCCSVVHRYDTDAPRSHSFLRVPHQYSRQVPDASPSRFQAHP